jgi:hypothetical protein
MKRCSGSLAPISSPALASNRSTPDHLRPPSRAMELSPCSLDCPSRVKASARIVQMFAVRRVNARAALPGAT